MAQVTPFARPFAKGQWRILLTTGGILAIFFSLVIYSMSTVTEIKENLTTQVNTRSTIIALRNSTVHLLSAETAVRGYFLSDDSFYLAAYHAALPDVEANLKELRSLTKGNMLMEKTMDTLEHLTKLRMADMAMKITAKQTRDEAVLNALHRNRTGRDFNAQIQAVKQRMLDIKLDFFEKGQEATARSISDATAVFIVEGVFALIATLFLGLTVFRELFQRRQKEEIIVLKNKELEEANRELSSFAYVASHDIKEPMRKIRTFSLIIKDSENLSASSHQLFNRIISAISRMERLIDSLFDFSKVNTEEVKFKPYDLNKVLEESKTYLLETIEEKQAVIESEALPVVKIVPIQFSQLMTNLMENSMKYSRKDVPPRIKITSSLVDGKKIAHPYVNREMLYHRISVADNGIGFEAGEEEKIFGLFQRLHGRSEYSGSGIGLAICKKIASNHNGFIIAEGKPNEGATFSVYIPN